MRHKSEAADAFRKFLADVHADGVWSKVEIARSDTGEYYMVVSLERCANCIASSRNLQTLTAQKRMVKRALGIIQNEVLAAGIQAPIIFLIVQLPPTGSLWAETVHWSCDGLNHTAVTANPGTKSPHEMWHGTADPASPHPRLRAAYCRWNRPSKSSPRAESCLYLGTGIEHPRESLRVLTRANKVVETREVRWEATLDVESPSTQLPEIPEQGGTQRIEDAPGLQRTEGFVSDSTTSLPRLGRGIPHQLRVVPPMTQASGDFRAEDVEQNDTSTASSESSDSDFSLKAGSDVSTSNSGALSDTSTSDGEALGAPESGAQTPTAVWTAARQLKAHMSELGNGEDIREGRTRAQTRALNREAAAGPISAIL